MTPERKSRPAHRRMSFEEFCAEHLGEDRKPVADEAEALPDEWKEKRRRRAAGQPPDFAASTSHALEWARLHARVWQPSIVDVKRVEKGRAALLIKGRRGGAVTLIMDSGEVHDCRLASAFDELEEVVL